MKKLIAIMLAALMLLSIVACGEQNPADTDDQQGGDEVVDLAYASAEELLTIILTKYNETASEDTQIGVNGGNMFNFDTCKMGEPAKFVSLEDSDYDYHLGYPTADVAKLDDAASMYHWNNANIFNCYAVHFANKADREGMIETIKNNILARHWECGIPEELSIITVPGDYLVVVWGVISSGGVSHLVADSVVANIQGATMVVDTPIV